MIPRWMIDELSIAFQNVTTARLRRGIGFLNFSRGSGECFHHPC
jgi:hypothetical protein